MSDLFFSNSILNPIIRFLFYFAMAAIAFYSFISLYSLIRFGKSRIIALSVGGVYVYLLLTLWTTAFLALNKIKF